jgi:hypothetical protein
VTGKCVEYFHAKLFWDILELNSHQLIAFMSYLRCIEFCFLILHEGICAYGMLSGLISAFICILVQDDEDLIIVHDALGFGQCHLAIGVCVLSWMICLSKTQKVARRIVV